jgi:hypothetical protein
VECVFSARILAFVFTASFLIWDRPKLEEKVKEEEEKEYIIRLLSQHKHSKLHTKQNLNVFPFLMFRFRVCLIFSVCIVVFRYALCSMCLSTFGMEKNAERVRR